MKIGFFDSGLGGLLILKSVAKLLPDYNYLYYGDTKNLPLGDRTESEILEYTKAGVQYLFDQDCTLIIIACNTSSCESLRRIQDTLVFDRYPNRRVLGVIIPTIEELFESRPKHAVLLATKRTVESGKYQIELDKQSVMHGKLTGVATPELVPLLEQSKITEALNVAKSAIENIDTQVGEVDGVILGCTHYTLLKDGLRELYGEKIEIFSQDEIVPKKIQMYLQKHPEIEISLTKGATRNIHLTEHREDYDNFIAQLLNGRFIQEG